MSELERNKQVARSYLSMLGAIDIEGIQKLFAEDVAYHVPNTGVTSGTMDLRRFLKTMTGLGRACPQGVKFDVLDLTAEEDRVSCRVDGHAKMFDGSDYDNRYHFLLKIRDGKIYEAYEYYDSLLVEKIFGPLLNKSKKPA